MNLSDIPYIIKQKGEQMKKEAKTEEEKKEIDEWILLTLFSLKY